MNAAARSLVVALAASTSAVGCSLLENVDDVVVGNGSSDSSIADGGDVDSFVAHDADATSFDSHDSSDAGADVTADAIVDATDATDGAVEEDRRWALWAVPATTPTSYEALSLIVADSVTSLKWQKDTNPKATLADAKATCAALAIGPLTSGWRLPYRVELVSLLAISDLNVPTINHTFFPGTPSAKHWTASSRPKGGIYVVDFSDGTVSTALDTEVLDFRCVHSP